MRTPAVPAALSATALVLIACGGSPDPKTSAAPRASTTGATTSPPQAARAPVSQLRRADVRNAIDKGLGVFLRNVTVDDYPVMRSGRFHGFRLKSINPEWAVDLRPGDVITRVNGLAIEHPEEADAAMRSLEKAPALKIEYERDGKPRTMELPIVD